MAANNTDQVYDFLDDVVKHPDNYDVPTDKVKELKTILQNLLRLR